MVNDINKLIVFSNKFLNLNPNKMSNKNTEISLVEARFYLASVCRSPIFYAANYHTYLSFFTRPANMEAIFSGG